MDGIIIYVEEERKVVAIQGKSTLEDRGEQWQGFVAEVHKQHIHADGWGITEYVNRAEFEQDVSEFELMLPVVGDIDPQPPLYAKTILGSKVASTIHRGPINEIGRVYRDLIIWVQKHGFQILGKPREYHLRCPHNTADEKGYVTELQLPIK